MKYDIFISYRRDTGQQYARILQMALEKIGYRVFLDYDEIKDGVFGDNIREAVLDAPIFMPVLSSQYLVRCKNEGDWVREEIMLAIKHNKHFVPVNPDGKHDGIPADIPKEIIRVISDNQHSEIMLGKMLNATLKLMVDERIRPHVKPSLLRRFGKNLGLVVLAATLVIGVVAYLAYSNIQDVSDRKQTFAQCQTRAQYEDFIKLYPNTAEAAQSLDSLKKFERLWNNNRVYVNNKATGYVTEAERAANTLDNITWQPDITLSQLRTCIDIFNRMILIRAKDATFTMGQEDDISADGPPHKVTLTQDFYLCQFEVTQGWWSAVMEEPLNSDSINYPKADITYDKAKEFCEQLSRLTGISFTLPTEAQWEFAALGGKDNIYSGSDDANDVAWSKSNSYGKVHPVGLLDSNEYQLFDMSGNVAEYCLDFFQLYPSAPQTDPCITTSDLEDPKVVIRGGDYATSKDFYLNLKHRDAQTKSLSNSNIGFRIVFLSNK